MYWINISLNRPWRCVNQLLKRWWNALKRDRQALQSVRAGCNCNKSGKTDFRLCPVQRWGTVWWKALTVTNKKPKPTDSNVAKNNLRKYKKNLLTNVLLFQNDMVMTIMYKQRFIKVLIVFCTKWRRLKMHEIRKMLPMGHDACKRKRCQTT